MILEGYESNIITLFYFLYNLKLFSNRYFIKISQKNIDLNEKVCNNVITLIKCFIKVF